jgi:hypothetical protein
MATFNSSNATLAADCRGEVGDYFTVYYACSVSLFTLLLVPAVNSIRTFQPNALAAHWYLSCKGHGLLLVALGLLARATSMAGVWISCSVEVWTGTYCCSPSTICPQLSTLNCLPSTNT